MYVVVHQFERRFWPQKPTRWVPWLLGPYPSALSFVRFPSSDAPTPALLSYQKRVNVSVCCNSPTVASTGPICKRCEIVNLVASDFRSQLMLAWINKYAYK